MEQEPEEKLISKKTGGQFLKFASVGVLNTAVDFGILNLLMWFFQIFQGLWLGLFVIISFTAAATNSYFWNKHWTFQDHEKNNPTKEFTKFFLISLGGAFINFLVVYSLTTFVTPLFDLSPSLWANGAKILATGLAWIWNFSGYKFWVFRA